MNNIKYDFDIYINNQYVYNYFILLDNDVLK